MPAVRTARHRLNVSRRIQRTRPRGARVCIATDSNFYELFNETVNSRINLSNLSFSAPLKGAKKKPPVVSHDDWSLDERDEELEEESSVEKEAVVRNATMTSFERRAKEMNDEFDDVDDFSLVIENDNGVRLQAVTGTKMVRHPVQEVEHASVSPLRSRNVDPESTMKPKKGRVRLLHSPIVPTVPASPMDAFRVRLRMSLAPTDRALVTKRQIRESLQRVCASHRELSIMDLVSQSMMKQGHLELEEPVPAQRRRHRLSVAAVAEESELNELSAVEQPIFDDSLVPGERVDPELVVIPPRASLDFPNVTVRKSRSTTPVPPVEGDAVPESVDPSDSGKDANFDEEKEEWTQPATPSASSHSILSIASVNLSRMGTPKFASTPIPKDSLSLLRVTPRISRLSSIPVTPILRADQSGQNPAQFFCSTPNNAPLVAAADSTLELTEDECELASTPAVQPKRRRTGSGEQQLKAEEVDNIVEEDTAPAKGPVASSISRIHRESVCKGDGVDTSSRSAAVVEQRQNDMTNNESANPKVTASSQASTSSQFPSAGAVVHMDVEEIVVEHKEADLRRSPPPSFKGTGSSSNDTISVASEEKDDLEEVFEGDADGDAIRKSQDAESMEEVEGKSLPVEVEETANRKRDSMRSSKRASTLNRARQTLSAKHSVGNHSEQKSVKTIISGRRIAVMQGDEVEEDEKEKENDHISSGRPRRTTAGARTTTIRVPHKHDLSGDTVSKEVSESSPRTSRRTTDVLLRPPIQVEHDSDAEEEEGEVDAGAYPSERTEEDDDDVIMECGVTEVEIDKKLEDSSGIMVDGAVAVDLEVTPAIGDALADCLEKSIDLRSSDGEQAPLPTSKSSSDTAQETLMLEQGPHSDATLAVDVRQVEVTMGAPDVTNMAQQTIGLVDPSMAFDATMGGKQTTIYGCNDFTNLGQTLNLVDGSMLTDLTMGMGDGTRLPGYNQSVMGGSQLINQTRRNITQMVNDSMLGGVPYFLLDYPGVPDDHLNILLHVCGQKAVGGWRQILPKDCFDGVRKLGEGVYGEVYSTRFDGKPVALKVIPFTDGINLYDGLVNGETLKTADEILPEVLITRELSELSDTSNQYCTTNFIRLLGARIVKGAYPPELLDAWDEFDLRKGSENDRPENYATDNQLFLCIALAMGGVDVESYQIKNEDEIMSIMCQLICALIVAERELEFEHRDLHIGNALVQEVEEQFVDFHLNGMPLRVRSNGVKVSVIDFTNSRLSKSGTNIYLDLEADDELFSGKGSYQFDIYRMMRAHNRGDWKAFNAKSNVFWMHYMSKELLTKKHKKRIPAKRKKELQAMFDRLLDYDDLTSYFMNDEVFTDVFLTMAVTEDQNQN